MHNVQTTLLLDRNLVARVVELAKGATAGPDHRLAAAVIVFAQCADIILEPVLSAPEGAFTGANRDEADTLAYFRAADNMKTLDLADVALGRADTLSYAATVKPGVRTSEDLSCLRQPLDHYEMVYPPVLKMGLIGLGGGPQLQRMRLFLDWIYDKWTFLAPAITFAACCFSASSPRGAFKGLRGADRQESLRGSRNSAWDLAYLMQWGSKMKQMAANNQLWLFCTLDRGLRTVAEQLLVDPQSTEQEADHRRRVLLGKNHGHHVALWQKKDDPTRLANRRDCWTPNYRRNVQAELEADVLRPR